MSKISDSPTSSTDSSLSSSERFGLDPDDTTSVLVYKYRQSVKPSSQKALCEELDADPNLPYLRCSRLAIPRGKSRVDIHQEDLYPANEREKWASLPNAKNNLVSVVLKRGWYIARLLNRKYKDMYIVSEETTPDNSPDNSQDGSNPNSRNPTFQTTS